MPDTTPQPLDLDAIRARADKASDLAQQYDSHPDDEAVVYFESADDVPALLAYVDRLHGLAAVRQARADTLLRRADAWQRAAWSEGSTEAGEGDGDRLDAARRAVRRARDAFRSALSAAPSDVLAEVKREAVAQEVENYADALAANPSPAAWDQEEYVNDVREWAAAIREGRS